MFKKNARQHVQSALSDLENAQECLNKAVGSVEKPQNKQHIQNTLNAVNTALQQANSTLSTYQE